MIRVELPDGCAAAERWALATLVDLSCLVPVDDPGADVVRLAVTDTGGPALHHTALRIADGVVHLPRACLATVVAVAGAGAEQGSEGEDRHGRVPSELHPLVRAGTDRTPVVHQFARALRAAVVEAGGRRLINCVVPWPDGHRWAVALTHDVDVMVGWPVFAAARLAEVLRRGRWDIAGRILAAAAGAIGRAPVAAAIDRILELEAAANVPGTWFVLAGDPTWRGWWRGDVTYRLEGRTAASVLGRVLARGHGLGLHGSLDSWTHAARFGAERRRVEAFSGRGVSGVRQHFLRMRPGKTQRAMAEAGFSYDATYGFPDRNGFRLGVADVVAGWDAAEARPSAIDEVPLVWMDRALSKYQGIEEPAALVSDALDLAANCRAVDGVWVGLWHPNTAAALGFPGGLEALADLIQGLTASAPWAAGLDDVVSWRRVRRSVRAARISEDGHTVLSPIDPQWPVVLEGPDGRRAA